jgi:hypothetical protein
MKNLKNSITLVIMTLVMILSMNMYGQSKKFNEKEVNYLKSEFRQGMANFVEGVKPFYRKGMSLDEFKAALVGENIKDITNEGNELVKKAYEYLVGSTSYSEIEKGDSGKEIAAAFVYVKKYNIINKTQDGDAKLFGGSVDNDFAKSVSSKRKCRWYQVGCHLSNVWDWLSGDPDGNGQTGAEELLDVLTTILAIWNMF